MLIYDNRIEQCAFASLRFSVPFHINDHNNKQNEQI